VLYAGPPSTRAARRRAGCVRRQSDATRWRWWVMSGRWPVRSTAPGASWSRVSRSAAPARTRTSTRSGRRAQHAARGGRARLLHRAGDRVWCRGLSARRRSAASRHRDARAPGDRDPSCSVNVETGVWHCWGCGAAGGASDAALAHGLAARDAIDVMIADDLATRRIGAPARRCPSSLARLEAQVPERPRGRGSRSTFCACATSPSRGRGRGVIGRIASFAGGLPLGELACCAGVAGNLQPVCGHPGHRRAERVTLGEERALLDQPRAVL